ncbi:MAG: TonB family protein [Proteobacteria bacterium]|nr:TonB family protein [Pseudomonadota bacterium]
MDAVLPTHPRPRIRPLHLWFRCGAILAAALAINLVLFGLMPYLLTRNATAPSREQVVSQVNIIRLKQPELQVKRSTEKPPEPPPKRQAPKQATAKPAPTKLVLPFDINPRLPGGPGTLALPTVPMARIGGLSDIFSTGDLDSPLMMLVRIPPIYPMSAKNRGTEGWVKVRFVVHEDGNVGSVSVVESEPKTIFDDAVIRSVSGWRFKAGTIGGVPVKTWAETVVRFKLD